MADLASSSAEKCSKERQSMYQTLQATQEVISRLPLATEAEFNEAVQAAKDAFPSWSKTAVGTRARVMFKLQQLIWENTVSPPPPPL
jgi:acyl-CoA reductase-like NAD-dependent aldehyde dehydrogenase